MTLLQLWNTGTEEHLENPAYISEVRELSTQLFSLAVAATRAAEILKIEDSPEKIDSICPMMVLLENLGLRVSM